MKIKTTQKIEITTTEKENEIITNFYNLIADIRHTMNEDEVDNTIIIINNHAYNAEQIINLHNLTDELYLYS